MNYFHNVSTVLCSVRAPTTVSSISAGKLFALDIDDMAPVANAKACFIDRVGFWIPDADPGRSAQMSVACTQTHGEESYIYNSYPKNDDLLVFTDHGTRRDPSRSGRR